MSTIESTLNSLASRQNAGSPIIPLNPETTEGESLAERLGDHFRANLNEPRYELEGESLAERLVDDHPEPPPPSTLDIVLVLSIPIGGLISAWLLGRWGRTKTKKSAEYQQETAP